VEVLVETYRVAESALFFDFDADFVGRTLPYAESIVVSTENVGSIASYALAGGSYAERVVGGTVASIDDEWLDGLFGWFGGFSGAFGECLDDLIDGPLGECFVGRLDAPFDDFLDVQPDAPSDAHLNGHLVGDLDVPRDYTSVALAPPAYVSSQLIAPASVFPDHRSSCKPAA